MTAFFAANNGAMVSDIPTCVPEAPGNVSVDVVFYLQKDRASQAYKEPLGDPRFSTSRVPEQ